MGETKKPWEETWRAAWRENAGYDCMTSGTEIVSTGRREIVTVDHGWRDADARTSDGGAWRNPQRDADAALIAAAPELYRALESLLEAIDDNGHWYLGSEQRREVALLLRKARGE